MKEIVCFGEVLWDMLPTGNFLGGAPLNVAYHLTRLGRRVRLVSAVGTDALGDAALTAMTEAGLSTGAVGRLATLPTGTVAVSLDAAGQARYTISQPVAWDEITTPPTAGEQADALVFGTLALRSETNRRSLRRWLESRPRLVVCDLNLRSPYDAIEPLTEFIRGVGVLKLNDAEARQLMPLALKDASVATQAAELAERFECATVCVTLGADGALLWHGKRTYQATAPRIQVRDTIGAGDGFTAALVDGILAARDQPDWTAVLSRACVLGAWVASRDGAQPVYSAEEVLGRPL